MYDIVLCVYERFRVDGLKRYVNDDRFRVDGDKNMRLLAFAFTIVFVWTGPKISWQKYYSPVGLPTVTKKWWDIFWLQLTPDNSNLLRKSKKVRVIGSLKQLTGTGEGMQ